MRGNIQYRRTSHRDAGLGYWALNVKCWAFLLLLVSVAPLLAQTNTNILPPLAPAYGEMQPTFWERYGTYVLVVSFVFIALAGAICWLVLRPKPSVAVPPEVLAREALEKLRHQSEDGNTLSEISQILRRYIGAAFGFPAIERTTVEFCAALAGNEKVGAELAQAVSNFLRECDQRKFAPVNPNAPLDATNRALEIVSEMEKQQAKFLVQK